MLGTRQLPLTPRSIVFPSLGSYAVPQPPPSIPRAATAAARAGISGSGGRASTSLETQRRCWLSLATLCHHHPMPPLPCATTPHATAALCHCCPMARLSVPALGRVTRLGELA